TVEEALEIALKELDASIDEVDYAVVEEPGKKRFGFGSLKNAKVSVVRRSESVSADTSLDSDSTDGDSSESSTPILKNGDETSGRISSSDSFIGDENAVPVAQADRNTSYTRDEVDYSSLTDEEIDKIADTAITVITK